MRTKIPEIIFFFLFFFSASSQILQTFIFLGPYAEKQISIFNITFLLCIRKSWSRPLLLWFSRIVFFAPSQKMFNWVKFRISRILALHYKKKCISFVFLTFLLSSNNVNRVSCIFVRLYSLLFSVTIRWQQF